MEKSDDALRTLFSGLSADGFTADGLSTDGLSAGDKAGIMARVREQAARRSARRENRFEWLMGAAAVALSIAAVAAVWIFAPESWRLHEMFAELNVKDLMDAIKLPKSELPETSFRISPLFILLLSCGGVLLFFDRLIRNRYNKKHLTEL